jgi:phage tail sheath protein FI
VVEDLMSVTPPVSYPGVYIQELPSAVHTITAVATSITAFVGYTVRGPENKATEILSWSDFERLFGGLASDSELSYAVKQFFDNGGTDAFVIRVAKDDGIAGEIEIGDNSSTPQKALVIDAISKGAWANNITVDVDYSNVSDSNSFNVTVTDLSTGAVETFDDVTTDPSSKRFVYAIVNDQDNGSKLITVKWPIPPANLPAAPTPRPAQTGTTAGDLSNVLGVLQPNGIIYSKMRISGGPISYGTLSKVWYNSGSTYTDDTVAAGTMGAPPFVLLSATTDFTYFGFMSPFSALVFTLATQGVGLTTSWQYYSQAGSWKSLTVKDNTSNFSQSGIVSWSAPSDWATNTVNAAGPLYWVRVSTSKAAATPPTSYPISLPLSYGALSKVWYNSGSTYTDDTVAAGTIGGPPFTILNAKNDTMYFGLTTAFSGLLFTLSQAGAGLNASWQYSKGASSWSNFATPVTDGTSNFSQTGSVTWTPPSDWATDAVNSAGPLYWVRATATKAAATPPTSIQIFAALPSPPYLETGKLTVLAAGQTAPASLLGLCNLLQTQANSTLQTALQNVPANPLPGAEINCVPSDSNLGIRVTAVADNNLDLMITFFDSSNDTLNLTNSKLSGNAPNPNVAHYWFGRELSAVQGQEISVMPGNDGTILPTDNGPSPPGNSGLIGDQSQFTGIYALDKVDLFNILCIPDLTRAAPGNATQSYLDTTGFTNENAILNAAMPYCEKRRAFLLADCPPQVNDVQSAIDWISSGIGTHDSNGAAYFPRIKLPDPLNNNALRTFAPCGVMAGLYARTDANRGVWKAPAGTEASLSGVQGLVYNLTDTENGQLNPLGLNCLRIFPVYGDVCWGARTLAGSDQMASQWKYVSVRRFALFLEESLYRGTKWVVFEPNDEPLWAQIRLNVGAFMQDLFRQGAFQGQTAQQAYFVKCDNETTTQTDIDNGIVNILVGFAPLKPAEFVVIKISQIAGQIPT